MSDELEFLLPGMTWSFSRLSSYMQCPYAWKLKYIDCEDGIDNGFGQFGTIVHKILEMYFKGELDVFDLPSYYEEHYFEYVDMDFPPNKFVDLGEKYYYQGLDYLNNISFELEKYEILGVEKKVEFEISEKPFVGFIDLLLKDKDTGEIIILDHKSASLKFKKNGEVSKSSEEHFESFKHQLYLYSLPILKEYGRVDFLCWNLFRDQKILKIPFLKDEFDETVLWAEGVLQEIENDENFLPYKDFYYCSYICDQRENGCPYK